MSSLPSVLDILNDKYNKHNQPKQNFSKRHKRIIIIGILCDLLITILINIFFHSTITEKYNQLQQQQEQWNEIK